MLNCNIERIAAAAAGSIIMAAAFKIRACKSIYIKIAFTAETPFAFFITINNQGGQFYTLNAQGIIHQSFGIAGFDLKSQQVLFGNVDQGRIVFIEQVHPVQQNVSDKAKPVLQEIIVNILVYDGMP